MADEKSNFYDYEAFVALPRKENEHELGPPFLKPLGRIEARDPDQALQFAAEKWPPPAGEHREFSVTLASKWRSKTYAGVATVAVEEVLASAGEPEPEPEEASGDFDPDTLPLAPSPGDSDVPPGVEA